MNEKVKSGSRNVAIVGPYLSGKTTLLESLLFVTSKVLQLVSDRRGQILGYEARNDWQNWDNISAYLPQAEMQDFIVELRCLRRAKPSQTLGVGSFHWEYDHLQEVPEKLAERVLASNGNGSNGNGK